MLFCRRLAGLALLALVSQPFSSHYGFEPEIRAAAQETQSHAQSSPAGGEATVLRTTSNLVLVDVVVTDHSGNAVHDANKEQFHIFEDGREQPIASFDEHKPGEGTAPASTLFAANAALPAHTFSNLPKYPAASAANVLLLDGLNTQVANQMDVRRQMIEYLGKIEPGTQLAIFTLSSRLRMVTGFSTDTAELAKAFRDPHAVQQSVVLDAQSDQDLDTAIGDMATLGGPQAAIQAMQQFQADVTAFQTDQRVQMTMDAMQQLGRYLSGVPGRKNLIWFSGSFPLSLDPDDSLQSPFQAMRNYSDEIRETAELLTAARVAVYPVDARGLMTLKTTDASYSPSTNLMTASAPGGKRRGGGGVGGQPTSMNRPNTAKDDANFMKQTMAEHASMEQIAEQTGGRDYVNTNGLKEAVANAIENGSSYYTIGYVPAVKLDGGYHKIELKSDSASYKLAYRHGYYADPPGKASAHNPGETSLIRAAMLHGAPPATQVLFQARVLPADDPALAGTKMPAGQAGDMTASLKPPLRRVIVDVTVDAHTLALEATPEGAHRDRVEFVAVAYDADGNRLNYLDRGFQLSLTEAQYAKAAASGIPIRLALDLPQGPAYLRLAVHDLDAGRAGSLEVRVAGAK